MQQLMTKKRGVCDYCSSGPRVLKGSPFIADAGKKMCSQCWKETKAEYWASTGEFIRSGSFYQRLERQFLPPEACIR